MQIVGGDYQLHVVTDNEFWPGYYTCSEADLKTWISSTGTDEWQELDAAVVPEKYQWPGLGYFYEADLGKAQIDGGWYDVKILISDDSGNYHQQVLRRAFCIGSGDTGIHDAAADECAISYAGGIVTARGAEHIGLYSVSGRLAASADGDTLAAGSLGRGVYVAEAVMPGGSRIVKKIIVR